MISRHSFHCLHRDRQCRACSVPCAWAASSCSASPLSAEASPRRQGRGSHARGGEPLGGPAGIATRRAPVRAHHPHRAPHRGRSPLPRTVPSGAGSARRSRARAVGTAATALRPGAGSLPTSYGHCRVLPLIPAFAQRHPEIELDLQLTNRNVDVVDEGFDLAVRRRTPADSGLVARKLEDADLVIVASPAYLRRRKLPHSEHDLASLSCIQFLLPRSGQPVPWLLRRDGRDFEWPTQRALRCATTSWPPSHWRAPAPAWCQTYRFIVEQDLRDGSWIELLPDLAGASRPFSVIHPGAPAHAAARARVHRLPAQPTCVALIASAMPVAWSSSAVARNGSAARAAGAARRRGATASRRAPCRRRRRARRRAPAAIACARCACDANGARRARWSRTCSRFSLAALVGAAVALDETAAQRDLMAESPIGARAVARPRRASARSWPAPRQSGCRGGAASAARPAARSANHADRRCGCRTFSGSAKARRPRARRRRSQRSSESRQRAAGSSAANSGTPGLKWS